MVFENWSIRGNNSVASLEFILYINNIIETTTYRLAMNEGIWYCYVCNVHKHFMFGTVTLVAMLCIQVYLQLWLHSIFGSTNCSTVYSNMASPYLSLLSPPLVRQKSSQLHLWAKQVDLVPQPHLASQHPAIYKWLRSLHLHKEWIKY